MQSECANERDEGQLEVANIPLTLGEKERALPKMSGEQYFHC